MDWTPDRVRALRKRLGLTQAAFADALGLARYQSVNELEAGRTAATGAVARLLDLFDAHGLLRPDAPADGDATAADRLDRAAREVADVARLLRGAGGEGGA